MRRKGMTIMLLWQEFVEHHPGERVHQYSQFSVNYRHYVKSLKRSLRMVHRAGEKLFIDFAGPTIKLTDGTKAHIFVAALAHLATPLPVPHPERRWPTGLGPLQKRWTSWRRAATDRARQPQGHDQPV